MILTFENISKSYGKTRALVGFSAQLTPGIYALLGPNGSGKTTLMNILTGNLKADAGTVTFTDENGSTENVAAMGKKFRGMLGFMPQYPGMYANFTLEEFLQYVATLKNVGEELPQKQRAALIKSQIDGVLQAVELSDVSHRRIGTLSGGMKQRLALAQAVLGDPKILILDEPTAGLDPKQRIAVRNYISRIAMGQIVIIATHVVSDVEFIAKEIIMLRKGEIINKAAPHLLLQELDGKVWELCVGQDHIAEIQSTFAVTNIAASEKYVDKAALRVLSDTQPAADAIALSPTLEDYYLYTFGKKE
ncbi:MAG: ATP-binding cassette domain-containing protein [Clostridia bacterium]|nr:ATP-binding cassette domain-containing protein [Clostridia bacterium]